RRIFVTGVQGQLELFGGRKRIHLVADLIAVGKIDRAAGLDDEDVGSELHVDLVHHRGARRAVAVDGPIRLGNDHDTGHAACRAILHAHFELAGMHPGVRRQQNCAQRHSERENRAAKTAVPGNAAAHASLHSRLPQRRVAHNKMHWGIRTPGFRSFKNRLLILIVGLIGLAQSATLLLALGYVHRDVYHTADQELRSAQSVLQRQLQLREARMGATAEVLISDFGFKEAVASADAATIRSALANQLNRIGAGLAVVYSPGGRLMASTGGTLPPRALDALVRPLSTEDTQGSASFYAVVDARPMQIVLIPLRAPEPIAWVA